ncbi:MAG: hypothetical protein IT545_13310 [Rhodobacteraceae bacterium]|nr:hypothetical protein [Paracoccaceae bacterium]
MRPAPPGAGDDAGPTSLRPGGRVRAAAGGGILLALPGAAFACALPPSVILTLPTDLYIAGAAITVGVTALMGAAAGRLPRLEARLLIERRILLPRDLTSYASFLVFLGLCLAGLLGVRDPMHNLMTLIFWTGVWVGLPLASLLLGNLWRPLNPWHAPVRIARALLGRTRAAGLSRLGHWPAVAGLFGFAWFMIVSLAPDDPAVLATAALGYWTAIFLAAVLEGEEWVEQGEFLTVFFGLVARVAPFWLETGGGRARLMAGWPGTQVLAMAPLAPSGIAFVTLALAVLSFDGLVGTFWWMALVGENPLEFTGRSAVVLDNTLGLAAAWAATAAAILGALAVGRRLAGRRGGFATGPVMLSFLAIAAGYHAAHYLVTLLTAGQYTLAALNDPLLRGDALLGLPAVYVSLGFLADRGAMGAIFLSQFAAILAAHLLAVLLALHLARRGGAGGGVPGVAHLPLTALMVGYTVMGLWLLSTARVS